MSNRPSAKLLVSLKKTKKNNGKFTAQHFWLQLQPSAVQCVPEDGQFLHTIPLPKKLASLKDIVFGICVCLRQMCSRISHTAIKPTRSDVCLSDADWIIPFFFFTLTERVLLPCFHSSVSETFLELWNLPCTVTVIVNCEFLVYLQTSKWYLYVLTHEEKWLLGRRHK